MQACDALTKQEFRDPKQNKEETSKKSPLSIKDPFSESMFQYQSLTKKKEKKEGWFPSRRCLIFHASAAKW